ncbi:MAG: right-handed parallel beta-helix repeat-containing protein [Lysobacterales bacterium]
MSASLYFCRRLWVGCLALVLIPASGQAAQFCVNNSSALVQALTTAAQSAEADEIRLVQGNYVITGNLYFVPRGSLDLTGGWLAGCVIRGANPASTVIGSDNFQNNVITLRPLDGGLKVEMLTFREMGGLLITDAVTGNNIFGTIRVSRNRFERNAIGTVIYSGTKHVRVENNLFVDNRSLCCGGGFLNTSLQVQVIDPTGGPVTVDVLFNTVLGGTRGLIVQGGGNIGANPRVQNNILRNALDFDLKVDDVAVYATHNIFGVTVFEDAGSFSTNSNNLVVDPLLSASYLPTAASAAVNSGTASVSGGLPITDLDGGPRQFGSKPDRGALETAISDTTTLTVTTTANSGAGSLRQAILDANASSNTQTIEFNISGNCPRSIVLSTPLPDITDGLIIDAFTQPGSSANTQELSYDGTHCVVLSGGTTHGLRLSPTLGENVTVRGLAFFDFTTAAIEVNGLGSATIEGNVFGTGAGVIANGFDLYAIRVIGSAATRIGGNTPAQRNLITRATVAGVLLGSGGNRVVEGNFFGFTRNGFGLSANGVGVRVTGGSNDEIRDNYIGYSNNQGVLIDGSSEGVKVLGNAIGLSPSMNAQGNFQAGNGTDGVLLGGGSNHQVRFNQIAYNEDDGIVVASAVQRGWISANRIHDNGNLGIDLSPVGVNPNNPDTGASGANRGHNYPLITQAAGGNLSGNVSGTLSSSNGLHTIDLYLSAECNSSGNGEGRYAIGQTSVFIVNGSAGSDGSASFSAAVSSEVYGLAMIGLPITATAYDGDGNTSEFSPCVNYSFGDAMFADGFE